MDQSRLVKYVRDLSVREREKFRQFVISPYFNQHQKTIDLLLILLDGLDHPNRRLSKESVYKKLFPKEAFDEQKLHNTMSYLKKLYHRFLAYQQFEKKEFQEHIYALEYAYENNQFDLLKNRGKQLEKSLSRHPYRNNDFYQVDYRLNSVLGYYGAIYEDRSKSQNILQRMEDSLDRYYIVEKLHNCCHLFANMILMNTTYDFHFLDELLIYIKENWGIYQDDTAIILYYTILMSLREENNPEHYQRLKRILSSEIDKLSVREQGNLYAFANNYCVRQINAGDSSYQQELFNLYKQGLRTELILDNGLLHEFVYKNITTLGCSLKEYEWTENFIQEYKDRLPAHRRENAYNYNLAHLYYSKKMYSEALSVLLLVQFTDVKYHLNTTFLLLRTYYALKDTEALLSLLETFRIYVMRNQKMTTDQKRGYTNFLRFAKKLVLLKHQSPAYSHQNLDEKLEALHKNVESTGNVINKFWLLEELKPA